MAISRDEEALPRRSILARLLRMPLKLLIYAVVLVVRPLRGHPKLAAIVTVVLGVGVVVWYSAMVAPNQAVNKAVATVAPEGVVGDPGSPPVTTQAPVPSPMAPLNYLRGLSTGDAHLMWLQLSQETTGQGGPATEDAIRTQLLNVKDKLGTVREIVYIGGSKMQDGTSVYVYVLNIRAPATDQVAQVPFTFTLDANGKITRIQ